MLLDDSIELECNDSSAAAESLPVTWDIDLSKIWIPSSVLPNRKKQINPNENKPFILHTLEKPDHSNTFSVYSDECHQSHESQASSSVPPIIYHHKLIHYNNDKHEIQQALPSSLSTLELNALLDICSENVISPKHSNDNNKPHDSLRDSPETYDSVFRNAAQCGKKVLDTYSEKEASHRASLDDLTRRMAEILSEDHDEDVIESNQIITGSTLDSIPPSAKDSLEELYYSDEDENQFAAEYELDNLEFETPEKKPTCSIYTENSYDQEQPSERFVNGPEQAKNSSVKTDPQSSEETEKIQFENQKDAVHSLFNQSEHGEPNGMEFVIHTKDSEQELLNCEEKSEDPIEIVPELPIAYKRPPLQEQTNKTKQQKKKTKKAKMNIPLEELFQKEEVDRFKVPEYDEFYENLVRQGKCKPHSQEINIEGFPSVNFSEKRQPNEISSLNLSNQSQNSFRDSAQKFRQILSSEPQSEYPEEIIRNANVSQDEEKAKPELESKDSLETLIIDDIPLNVPKENIESFILDFGKLNYLCVEKLGKFQRATIQMYFTEEVDWVIECLNGSQPFGGSDKELIKCYRQT